VWALRSTEGSNPSLSVPGSAALRRFALYNPRVASPLSKSQVERLGERLVASDEPANADLQLLRELLLSRSSTLQLAIARVRDHLQLAPTSRIKNTGTKPQIEIVALVAESEEAARITHGRYFLGLTELANRIA
jgi:hypothetical protein